MARYTESMEELIRRLGKFPGVGPKSAERMAFYILHSSGQDVEALTQAISKVKKSTGFCKQCNNLSEGDLCAICKDPGRDHTLICVVEEPKDIIAIEKGSHFRGIYHVLLGALSPLDGIGPDDLKIKELISRIKALGVKEVIIATNSDTEGEATALYLTKVIRSLKVKLTRIAFGVPIGSDLEYADQVTLSRSLAGRRDL
ncbi:MAG: recombination protein RecR [Candidatus Omnitrophica bacterium]|nr:recombination protein RecR [Candidatus Omnitrophota bacterium]